jgi:predicted ATPase
MSRLERIEIEGFKSIRQVALDLRPLTVLVGANGAGKSNLLSAFELLRHLAEERLQRYVLESGGAEPLLHFGRKRSSHLRLSLRVESDCYEVQLAPSEPDTLFVEEERWWATPAGEQGQEKWGGASRESHLHSSAQPQSPLARRILERLRSWRTYHFHDTSRSAKVKLTGDIEDNESLRPDASNLAAFLYLLRERHSASYRRIVSTVRLVAPFFSDFRLRPQALNPQKILLEWSAANSETYFSAHALSDGTLRFICLATLLLQPTLPSLVIIDEPELGLHPYAIQLLADLVQGASQQTQLVLSTQSVTLLDQLQPEDVVVAEQREGESLFRRLEPEELRHWLDEYSLGELLKKNVLGGGPG